MRIKCILGDEIRVVTAKREVTEDELLRLLGQEYGRAIIGLFNYEIYSILTHKYIHHASTVQELAIIKNHKAHINVLTNDIQHKYI